MGTTNDHRNDSIDSLVRQQWRVLPVSLQEMVSSPRIEDVVAYATQQAQVPQELTTKLVNEILFVLLALEPRASFSDNLQRELALTAEQAAGIAGEAHRLVFEPVAKLLDSLFATGQPIPGPTETGASDVPHELVPDTVDTSEQPTPQDRTLPELLLARAYEKKGGEALAAPTDSSAPAPEPSTPSEPGPEKPRYERADPYREPVSGQ